VSQSDFSVPQEPASPSPQNPFHAPQASLETGERSYVTRSDEPLNPWVSIWTRPRATIRQIVDTDPTYMVVLLASIGGIARALDNASRRNTGDNLPLAGILVTAMIAGPLGGLIMLYLSGALVRWTGSLLGGVANSVQVRAALAWGQVPTIGILIVWGVQIALLGKELFSSETPSLDAGELRAWIFLATVPIDVVLAIWAAVLIVKCVAEVHQFSAWKGLGALMLAGLVFILVIFFFVAVFIALAAAS
jgi:hypothetical protein